MKLRPLALLIMMVLVGATVGQATTVSASTFPGANGKIIFSSGAVEVINPNGTGRSTLASAPPASRYAEPAWNAAASKIVFKEGGSSFLTMNANGSKVKGLFSASSLAGNPTWSADGSEVAFDQGSRIYVVPASGGNATELVGLTAKDPTYSPDGTRIAFEHLDDGDIGVMDADGTNAVSLEPADDDNNDEDPSWSPDGTKIAFNRNDQIWTMNADGSGATQVAVSSENASYPTWSPDGSKIAFASDEDLWVVDAAGGAATNITNTANEDELEPDWGVAPTVHRRSISLALKKHLKATGKVTVADGYAACIASVVVKITRNGKTVAKTRTNDAGAFKARLRDRAGRYMAVAPKVSPVAGHLCSKATSPKRRNDN